MNLDRVSYLQEVPQNEAKTDIWKSILLPLKEEKDENNLPFMSQLTTNSTGSSVTLRDGSRNNTEVRTTKKRGKPEGTREEYVMKQKQGKREK